MDPAPYALGAAALIVITAWAFLGGGSVNDARARSAPPGIRADPSSVYNPVLGGERLPDGFRQLLPRDGIMPVYDPAFVAADEVGWPDGTQVIGVSSGGEAKAYPVSFLNGREMVVDDIDGIPILVTW